MVKNYDRQVYVITSIQGIQEKDNVEEKESDYDLSRGAPNEHLIEGFEHYCKLNDGKLIFLTMNGMNRKETKMHHYFNKFEEKGQVLRPKERRIKLNQNCTLEDFISPPQNMNPLTSKDRLMDQTSIFAGSKQALKSIASGNGGNPKILATTGASTYPNYDMYSSRGDQATKEHIYGAIIVEIIDSEHYNLRHIRAYKNGKFIDMARLYDGDRRQKEKVPVEALVFGDWHLKDEDEKTMIANYEMVRYFNPKRAFIHDLFNGNSVNPHERLNLVNRIIEFETGRLSIEEELKYANKKLNHLAKIMKGGEINVVASNHDFFLNRYLERGDFMKEPWNARISLKLAQYMIDGKNPVEEGIKMMGPLHSSIKFLDLDSDYRVRGWQLASHGHQGISGSRGSIKSREIGDRKSISGHSHAPESFRNTVIVGTSTKLNLKYTLGSKSRWMGANAVLYPTGQVQLLTIINGKWRMKKYRD